MMHYEQQLKTVKLYPSHTVLLPTVPTAGAIDANVMMVIKLAQSMVCWTLPSEMIPDVTRNLLLTQQKSVCIAFLLRLKIFSDIGLYLV